MKNMKRIACIALCLLMTAACVFSAAAETESETHATGLIWETWEDYLQMMRGDSPKSTLYALMTQRRGDVNGDGVVTAEDSRLALRYAASLENLTESRIEAADIDGLHGVTAADARKILRASADLETLEDTVITTTTDWGVVIGPLQTAGSGQYTWECSIDKDGLTMEQFWCNPVEELRPGDPVQQFFAFTPGQAGEYTLTFRFGNSWSEPELDSFRVSVQVEK